MDLVWAVWLSFLFTFWADWLTGLMDDVMLLRRRDSSQITLDHLLTLILRRDFTSLRHFSAWYIHCNFTIKVYWAKYGLQAGVYISAEGWAGDTVRTRLLGLTVVQEPAGPSHPGDVVPGEPVALLRVQADVLTPDWSPPGQRFRGCIHQLF